MKPIKNHFSLILALFAILFAIQILTVNNRAIHTYEKKLSSQYSMIVVSNSDMTLTQFQKYSPVITKIEKLSPAKIIEKLKQNISEQNIQLLKVSLPRFYKIHLNHYPSPGEVQAIKNALFQNSAITKIEDFSKSYNTTFKLLLLFKTITQIFTIAIFAVTVLLIAKEMKIWQFKHNERMNIMGLFGAPVWLRSAVLFRMAIVDALIATFLSAFVFSFLAHTAFIKEQLATIDITINIFEMPHDLLVLGGAALLLSLFLASIVVAGYKEEI
jgi:cell division transport system permease protein